jgi:hypothetical protein
MYAGLRPRQGRARLSGLTGSVTKAVYGTCVEQVMNWRCQDRKMVLRYLLEDGHGGARLMGALAGCQKENQERTITRNIPILGALVLSCYTLPHSKEVRPELHSQNRGKTGQGKSKEINAMEGAGAREEGKRKENSQRKEPRQKHSTTTAMNPTNMPEMNPRHEYKFSQWLKSLVAVAVGCGTHTCAEMLQPS